MIPATLKVKEAAKLLRVSAALVYHWIETGALACYRLGKAKSRGAIRLAEADVVAFLETLRTQKKPEPRKAPAPKAAKGKSIFRHINVG